MKKSVKVRFPRPLKVLILSTLILSATTSVFAQEGEESTQFRSMYYTIGYKKMPNKAQGSGITYGAGLKYRWFGMEFYSADMVDMPKGMERYINGVGVKGTDTSGTVISDKGFGIDYNLYCPIFRHFEIYAGPSTAFEKEARVYSAIDNPYVPTGEKYADGIGTWRTRFGGQAGIMFYVPTNWHGMNVSVNAGYSTYRGITGGLGIAF